QLLNSFRTSRRNDLQCLRKDLKSNGGGSNRVTINVHGQTPRGRNLHAFSRENFHFRVVMAMTTANRPKMAEQLQLAEIPVYADRKEAVVQNRTGTDVEISSVVRTVPDRHKRTPQSDPTLRASKSPAPPSEWFISPKQILIGGGYGSIESQYARRLPMQQGQANGVANSLEPSTL